MTQWCRKMCCVIGDVGGPVRVLRGQVEVEKGSLREGSKSE